MLELDSPAAPRCGAFTPRALTGDRPTGQLHLGHLFGTLLNRVSLQAEGVDLMVLIADYQTITDRDSPSSLPQHVDELVADYLAVGIDPSPRRCSARPRSCWAPMGSNLILLSALCEELEPRQVAEQIGSRGAAELKRRATEAVNERLRPIREHRSELMRDRGYLREILRHGSAVARSIAQSTLAQVAEAMHTSY